MKDIFGFYKEDQWVQTSMFRLLRFDNNKLFIENNSCQETSCCICPMRAQSEKSLVEQAILYLRWRRYHFIWSVLGELQKSQTLILKTSWLWEF